MSTIPPFGTGGAQAHATSVRKKIATRRRKLSSSPLPDDSARKIIPMGKYHPEPDIFVTAPMETTKVAIDCEHTRAF
uniref:Uncharacterized protein n=1 Tax=Hyaloperonospora arabidopsidis (strain Emoy2) TaxID=559515 RepID=M4BLH7_HYAAE